MIAELVWRETGVTLPPGRVTALTAALRRVAPGLDPGAFLLATSDPVHGRHLVDRLIDEVTVQETTFARDLRQLETIEWRSLLRGVRGAGSATIRVWSAGCATGEEAYTLAMLAAEALAQARAPVDVLGTDISGAALAAAKAGRYRERAVAALEPSLRERHLERMPDGSHLVSEQLRSLVRFRRHNLARDPIPPPGEAGFDVVVCRNVLIYFAASLCESVIVSLTRSLRPGGMLVLGAADALQRRATWPAATAAGPVAKAAGKARRRAEALRRPLGRQPSRSREHQLEAALAAAGKGDRDDALALVAPLLAADSLDADAHFVQGLVTLAAGDPARAAAALRRALYADSAFSLAAFTLGRAYDALGDTPAARRAYMQALRMLDAEDDRHELMLQQVDIGDIAVACRARLWAP